MHIELLGGGKFPIEDVIRGVVAFSAFISAFITVFLGQLATSDARFFRHKGAHWWSVRYELADRMAILQQFHRIAFYGFALSLMYHANEVVSGSDTPGPSELFVFSTMMIVCVISAVQRYLMPPAPREDRPLFTLSRGS